ncbi:LOW QUALITY PROTEIN: uncharacterized protein si:ch211-244b2.3 [Mugil cephalus]|uniref:LOW QUALITY PROTEIN: uncharacterized protein si:ch211-244b2.3 n=1 Tax=Mugil cephalus TaxID=48193 RepID=UPI001FB57CDD|nr:LOW QUALITY PROTEIN: uncharacterized protein si:ch211-244b2.3 [Mugil cephalus]
MTRQPQRTSTMYFPQITANEEGAGVFQEGVVSHFTGSGKHYEWQLCVGHQWLRIDNDHVIETHYCQPGAKGITINTSHGQVFIDFDTLQSLDAALKVQRLSFLSHGQTEDIGWYYRDDQLWCEYGSQGSGRLSSSLSSADIERHFTLQPQGTLRFTVGSTSYSLDFSTMTQTNLTTGLQRNVRRRPKFTSSTGSVHSTSVPGEFMGDEGEWIEYQPHVCSLDSAAIETQHQLNPQGQLHFNVNNRYSYTLDFSRMCQINNKIGTRRAVRRIQQNSSGTVPRWQFQDVDGVWKDYSKGFRQCSSSSQDIELQYQLNPSGTMTFTTNNFSYEINFTAMTQRNRSTNTTRPVRRLNQ